MTDNAESPAVRRLDDWDLERLESLATEYETPLYVMDCDRVKANYTRFSNAFPDAHVMYAAKAHTGKAVLELFSRPAVPSSVRPGGNSSARLKQARTRTNCSTPP